MAEIQRNVDKMGERGTISHILHAINDKGKISAWKSDLKRILHVFNVSTIVSSFLLLIVCFQTELAMNTHVAVLNTQNLASEIHRTMLEQATEGRRLSVSNYFVLPVYE